MSTGPTVILSTEGSFPYYRSGAASWCEGLTSKLAEVDFTILAFTSHPYLAPQYGLASNVREVITVPLWGTKDPAEYGPHATFVEYLQRRWAASATDIQDDFVPSYTQLLREIVTPAIPARSLGMTLLRLHQHLRRCDFQRTQTNEAVWDAFVAVVPPAWREVRPAAAPPTLEELGEAWRLLGRLLLPLSLDLPRVSMMHASGSGFCGLPCVIQKLRWGTPYLLTEHDVYLREQYLSLHGVVGSLFVRWFVLRLVSTVVDVNYAFADQVSPACQDNARWTARRGVDAGRTHVIPHGVDPLRFFPTPPLLKRPRRPLVVAFGAASNDGRHHFLEAAALLRKAVPEAEFRVYGSSAAGHEMRRCQERARSLNIADRVAVSGPADEPGAVLRDADVVVLAGASTGVPFELIEAMMTGCAIVAADAGGVRETLGETGLIVRPNEPGALAEAIETLLQSPQARQTLGEQARDRALQYFTEHHVVDEYRRSYARLITGQQLALTEAPQQAEEEISLPAPATASV